MGLKTTNYKTKRIGVVMPTAYAKFKSFYAQGNYGFAVFGIQSTREAFDEYPEMVEEVTVSFSWDRKSNPVELAYNAIKEENGTLYGWQDDIVG